MLKSKQRTSGGLGFGGLCLIASNEVAENVVLKSGRDAPNQMVVWHSSKTKLPKHVGTPGIESKSNFRPWI